MGGTVENIDSQEQSKPTPRGVVKWIKRIFIALLIVLLIPVTASLLLHIPAVQNWAAQKVSNVLSEKTQTVVSLKRIDFSVFDGLALEGFKVSHYNGVEMISCQSLNVALSNNIFSLLNNKLLIDAVSLYKPSINITIDGTSRRSDLAVFLEKLTSKKDEDPTSAKISLKINKVDINYLNLSIHDELKNQETLINADELQVLANNIDIINNTFNIKRLYLKRPQVYLLKKGTSLYIEQQTEKQIKKIGLKENHLLELTLGQLIIENGSFFTDDDLMSSGMDPYKFDSRHMNISDINFNADGLYICGEEEISLNKLSLSLKERKGWTLDGLNGDHLRFDDNEISMPSFTINTDKTQVSGSVSLKYTDKSALKEFKDRVMINALVNRDSKLSLDDLSFFIPGFEETDFYKNNTNKEINLSGKFIGRLNNLKGTDVVLDIPGIADFNGSFGVRNIFTIDDAIINLRVNSLNTSILGIKSIVSKFNPPDNFYKLGRISFSGHFDGYLEDFVAYGELNTDLGTAITDMRLDLKDGVNKASYSGDIALQDFDLRAWTGNEDFGKVSFTSKVINGVGLTLDKAKANLQATITNFEFKKYNYKNLSFKGELDRSTFSGKLVSSDENVNLDFNGNVVKTDKDFLFDFDAKMGRVDLAALNLSSKPLVIKGDIDFKGSGTSLNDIVGQIKAHDITIIKGDSTLTFDTINIVSERLTSSTKRIYAKISDNVIRIDGKANFNNLVNDVKDIIKLNFPYHTRSWKYTAKLPSNEQDIHFDVSLGKSRDLLTLLNLSNINLSHFKAKGSLNSSRQEMNFVSSIPKLSIEKNTFYGVQLLLNNKLNNGDLHLHVDSFNIGKKKFNEVFMSNVMQNDEVDFSINADNIVDSVQNLTLEGKLMPHEKGYSIAIGNNLIKLYGQRWKINNAAIVSLGNKYIDIQNMSVTDGSRTLDVHDINNTGLSVQSDRFDIKTLNPIINYNKMIFSGEATTIIKVSSIFTKSPEISGNILIPAFTINDDLYGDLAIDVSKPEKKPVEAILSLTNKVSGSTLKLQGNYDVEKKFVNASLKAKKVPIKFLEYILKDGISLVKGSIDINADAQGPLNDLTLDGLGTLNEGRVRVNYLGESYFFDKQKIIITDKVIDLTGAQLKDSQGNIGTVTGGLKHKLFGKFSLDANISGDNVIAINTTKFDNDVYYGLGRGQISVDFSGPLESPFLLINATTTQGTRLNIPIKESSISSNKSFITFIDKNKYFIDTTSTKTKRVKIEGVSIVMNLTITESAEVNLIFDEATGDVINGTGNGNLKINMSNRGEFEIFGDYRIEQGRYLFTALNGVINKPFVVRRGGSIRWTGDPVNATLNITADYSVRTSTRLFLEEYLTRTDLKSAASNATTVNLKLILGNTLYSPTVKFSLEFPELIGELRSYADSKLRIISTNESDLNSQVFGLLIFNSFLPSNALGTVLASGSYLQDAGINTMTEWISSQLSLFVTSYLNQALEENGLISGIDFEFDLRNNTSLLNSGASQNSILPSEIQINLKNRFRFLDERLTLNVGGNYVRQSFTGTQDFIIPEFFVEYALTKDRKVNLKLYAKYSDIDEINLTTNRRNKFGIGIRYRTEFGPMLETKTDLNKFLKEAIATKKKDG